MGEALTGGCGPAVAHYNRDMMLGFRTLPVLLVAWAAMASDVKIVEQIVAKVNGDIVTTTELSLAHREIEAALRQQGLTGIQLENRLSAQQQNILRDRIDNLLFVQKAKEEGINVDGEVTKYFAERQRLVKIADQEQFREWVRQQVGKPFEDYRQEVRDSMMTQRLVEQEVGSKITIPRAEIEKYYQEHQNEFIREERVFLSEILLSTSGKDEKQIAALEKKAKGLVERARQGEKFAGLAKDNSESQSAGDGGQLPPMRRRDLLEQLAKVVFDQDRGFVTDPIRTPNGFMILRVDQKHKAGLAPLEEVENEVTNKLYGPRFEPAIRTYLSKLRQDAFLEIREGFADTGAVPGKDTRWMDPAQLKPETVSKEEVASQVRRRRLLWMVPVPGTTQKVGTRSKSD
jgi:peptidyl-prolyl cis-trans isomerase SurA